MAMQLPDFGAMGTAIGQFGTAAGDLTSQEGFYKAARSYTTAGNLEAENTNIARSSGEIQKAQAAREAYIVNSSTGAAAGKAGLSMSGSMQDVLRASQGQQGLRMSLISGQAQINTNNFDAQAKAYYSESDQATVQGNAAGAASGSNMLGGMASMASSLAPLALAFL